MEYKKYNKDNSYSYCFGGFPTYELLKNKIETVREIIVHEKMDDNEESRKILELAKKNRIRITKSTKTIEKLSGKGNVYIMAVFDKYNSSVNHHDNQVLIHSPSDTGNLGTIMRVMVGFGYKNLSIIRPSVDVFDPKTIRASMGSIFSLNVELFDSIDGYREKNKNHMYPFMLQATTSLQELTKKENPHTLAFGNEAHGLDIKYLNYGTPLLIKHSKNIDSLNLSMAVGIALYEFNK